MHSRFTRIAGTAILSGFTAASLFTMAPSAASADEQDPGVARISLLTGGVDVKRADSGDTVSAAVNAPLNAGDYLTTQDGARAELQLDDLTELRVAPDTQLRFTTLSESSNALQLAAGTVELRLFRGNGANPEIDTPNASIRPLGNGAFRVSVDNDGNAIVSVRSGQATVATQNDSQNVTSGTSIAIDGGAGDARFESIDTVADDDFDNFNADRDRHESDSPSYAYVDDQFVGADDLDQYGSWQDVDGYGEVWHPHYASGWAPYQDGNWTWEPYYGWTWVSAEPWGWAPYHYGRWFYASNNGGWCWTPATQYFRPEYRPAQVAFFSFGFGGGGGGISVGFGNVGWVALGPTDPFRPWWGGGFGGRDRGGITTIDNVTNVTNVTNIYNYRNINSPGAIIAVRNANFQSGNFGQRLAVSPGQLRGANISPVRGVVPVLPTRANLAYRGGEPVARRYPLSPTFARFKAGARTAPGTFAEQRAAVSRLAQSAYPAEAKNFEREAPVANEPSRNIPVTRGEESGSASRGFTEERTPALEQKPASAWDRFDRGATDRSATGRSGATPEVTNVRDADKPAARAESVEPRPSYAQPDTNPRRATSPRSEPPVQTIDGERTGGGAATSPWDRFSSSPRATHSVSTERSSGAQDETRRTYAAPETAPATRRNANYGDEATQRRYARPDAAPERTQTTHVPSYSHPVTATHATHAAGSDTHAAPAERHTSDDRGDRHTTDDHADTHH